MPQRPGLGVTFHDDGTPDEVHFPVDLRMPWAEFERFYRPLFERTRETDASTPAEDPGEDDPSSE